MAHIKRGLAVAAYSLALLSSGCASYYIADTPQPAPLAGKSTLPASIQLAEAYHQKYRTKVVELGGEERAVSNATLALGAAAFGLAVGKAHASAIQGAAVGAGGTYAFGLFNTDRRRAQIYIEGMKGLECLEAAISPLSAASVDRLETTLESARQANTAVSQALGDLYASGGASFPQADDPLKKAKDAKAATGPAQAAAMRVLLNADKAAFELRRSVFGIDRAVLDALKNSDPDLKNVPSIVAHFASIANQFVPDTGKLTLFNARKDLAGLTIPGGGRGLELKEAEVAAPPELSPQAKAALSRLVAETGSLEAANEILKTATDAVFEGYNTAAMKDCKVADVPKAAPFTLSPQTLAFDEGEAAVKLVVVNGATPPISAKIIEATHAGLTVGAPDPVTRQITVTSTADLAAKPSSFQLAISDATGQSQIITITVAPKTAEAAPTDTKGTPPGAAPNKRKTPGR